MTVLGYEVGPLDCEAAVIADFDVASEIPIQDVVSQMDSDRRVMAERPGMVMKYTPLRFDPATGAHQIGGRYLFRTIDQMRDYVRFTSEELEFEPGVKFWERPFFSNIDKRGWQVIGAHAFAPIDTHHASRVERLAMRPDATEGSLRERWSAVRDAAGDDGLAAVWLLRDPERQEVALLTAVAGNADGLDPAAASASLAALERRSSLSRLLEGLTAGDPLSDRASLNLATWLPLSGALGGDACVFPSYPTNPRPEAS